MGNGWLGIVVVTLFFVTLDAKLRSRRSKYTLQHCWSSFGSSGRMKLDTSTCFMIHHSLIQHCKYLHQFLLNHTSSLTHDGVSGSPIPKHWTRLAKRVRNIHICTSVGDESAEHEVVAHLDCSSLVAEQLYLHKKSNTYLHTQL